MTVHETQQAERRCHPYSPQDPQKQLDISGSPKTFSLPVTSHFISQKVARQFLNHKGFNSKSVLRLLIPTPSKIIESDLKIKLCVKCSSRKNYLH